MVCWMIQGTVSDCRKIYHVYPVEVLRSLPMASLQKTMKIISKYENYKTYQKMEFEDQLIEGNMTWLSHGTNSIDFFILMYVVEYCIS